MAQSSSNSAPLSEKVDPHTGVPYFWSRPSAAPPNNWKKWLDRFHLAASLKEGCDTRLLMQDPTETVPEPEPKPEPEVTNETVEDAAARVQRNMAAKRKWTMINEESKRKGPRLAHNVFYFEALTKVRARLYMALGEEGISRFHQKHPRLEIHETSLRELVEKLEATFKAEENVIYERFVLFSRTQKQNETLEAIHAALTDQAAKCELQTLESELVRDLFIARMNIKLTELSELQKSI